MLRICEKLRDADAKSRRHGLVRTVVAEKFHLLDQTFAAGGYNESLLVEYTKLMVEGIANKDGVLEVEAIKSLGDVYLRRGTETRDLTCLTKATALYNTALERCGRVQGRAALIHRLLSYDDHLKEGDCALADGKLDTAEEKFASALRMVHDSNKPDRSNEADCLRRLGDVYVQRGKKTEEGRKFTQAAALYNAAMARTDKGKDRIQASLRDTEKWFLQHTAQVDSNPSPPDSAMRHQKGLEDMRARAKSQLEDIDRKHNPYQYDEDDPKMIQEEAKRAEAVKALFKTIAKDRQTFIQALVDECIATLGSPSCKYAFIGLGSQATELVTPYSDLEFAILIEEGKDDDDTRRYFLNLTHYLHLKVINLGETILPAMAIPSLNDFYSEDPAKNWFFDSVAPRGFSFDGFMPWACKTPFGRDRTKTKEPVSLIQTPAKMAEFQQLEVALAEGYHLSDILRRFAFLAGDDTLVSEYQERLNEVVTNDLVSDSKSRFSAMQILQENREMLSAREPTGELLNVKKDIYRFPGIAIEVLALCCQVNLASTWAVIDRLRETGQVQEDNAAHLTVLTSISAELRLRTYMANGGQRDSLSPLAEMKFQSKLEEMSDKTLKSEFHIPDTQILFLYYCRAIPLKKCIPDIVKDDSQDQSRRNLLLATSLKNLGLSWGIRGNPRKAIGYFEQSLAICKAVFGEKTAHPDIAATLSNIGFCLSDLGDHQKAKSYFEQSLKMRKTIYGETPHEQIAISIGSLGYSWSSLGDEKKALDHYKQSLAMYKTIYGQNTIHPAIALELNNMGLRYSNLGDQKKAVSCYEQSLVMKKAIYGVTTCHQDIAMSHHNVGLTWAKLGNHKKAIGYYDEALKMLKDVYGEKTPHPDIAIALYNLGESWRLLGDYRKAVSYFERFVAMKKIIHGEDIAQPKMVMAFSNLGICWSELGDQTKAISYSERSLRMARIIHRGDTAHAYIAGPLLSRLGECCGENWEFRRKHNCGDDRKAITFYEQSLEMWKTINGDKAAHPEIAGVLYNVGLSWNNLGDKKKATSYLEQSLSMRKILYGDNKDHPEIAMSLLELGSSWSKIGDQIRAISYLEQSLTMMKTVYGDNSAHLHIGKILYELGYAWSRFGFKEKALEYMKQAESIAMYLHASGTPRF
ncbi:hypothetical protein Bbelb_077890 [Branchiostoma belcheri]|nr:hypothetical protein Bbelb_077890 [Branchiostoma belcheri]